MGEHKRCFAVFVDVSAPIYPTPWTQKSWWKLYPRVSIIIKQGHAYIVIIGMRDWNGDGKCKPIVGILIVNSSRKITRVAEMNTCLIGNAHHIYAAIGFIAKNVWPHREGKVYAGTHLFGVFHQLIERQWTRHLKEKMSEMHKGSILKGFIFIPPSYVEWSR